MSYPFYPFSFLSHYRHPSSPRAPRLPLVPPAFAALHRPSFLKTKAQIRPSCPLMPSLQPPAPSTVNTTTEICKQVCHSNLGATPMLSLVSFSALSRCGWWWCAMKDDGAKGKDCEGGFCVVVVLVMGGLRWCLVVEVEDGPVGPKEREKEGRGRC